MRSTILITLALAVLTGCSTSPVCVRQAESSQEFTAPARLAPNCQMIGTTPHCQWLTPPVEQQRSKPVGIAI